MIEWETILLYLVGLLGVLSLAALLVWGLFYLYSYKCDKESDLEDDDAVNPGIIRTYIHNRRREEAQGRARQQLEQSEGAQASGRHRQTMLSSLHRPADETDVVVASALSSIPLRELGGRDSEVVVDVAQQMYLNREELDRDEHQCIVCRSRKEIAWAQVSCYARTTIGVLVYKRPDGATAAAAAAAAAGKSLGQRQPVLSVTEELRSSSVGVVASGLGEPKSQSVSTVTIAPSPDSRIQDAEQSRETRSHHSSQQSSKSANFSNKSPPSLGGGSDQKARKSPQQTANRPHR